MLFLQTFLLLVISSLVVFGQHTFSSGSSTYTLIEQPKTWEAAKSYAEGQGGQLLEIDSATEMEVVQNALESYFAGMSSAQRTAFLNATRAPDGGGAAYLWLGGSDAASEGEWRWVSTDQQFWSGEYYNGNSVGGAYHNWGTLGGVIQEPDNYQNQDALALGLEAWPYGAPSSYLLGTAYQWNDIDLNSNQLYFIIEKDLGDPGISAPSIDTHPATQSVTSSSSVTLSVSASGEAVSYQWQTYLPPVGWQDIQGATSSSYTATYNGINAGGAFRVVASNSAGSVTSDPAQVIVEDPSKSYTTVSPAVTWSEAKAYAESQGGYLLEINSYGEWLAIVDFLETTFAAMSDEDYSDFLNSTYAPDGGTAAYIWLGGSDAAVEGEWRWASSNEQFWSGGVNGSAVNGAFNRWGKTTQQNEPDNYNGSQDALALALETWPLGSYGTGNELGYAYYWNDISAENQLYFIIEKDLGGPGVSAPSIDTHPTSRSVTSGSSVTLSVSASGEALSYQWYKGGSVIAGATSATYTIGSASEADSGAYTVEVSNSAGSVTSNAATLSVEASNPAPPSLAGKSFTLTPSTGELKSVPNQATFAADSFSYGFSGNLLASGVSYSYSNGTVTYDTEEVIKFTFTSDTGGTYEEGYNEGDGFFVENTGTFEEANINLSLQTNWQRSETMDSALSTQYWQIGATGGDTVAYNDGELNFIFESASVDSSNGYFDHQEIELTYAGALPLDEDWQIVIDDTYVSDLVSQFAMGYGIALEGSFDCEFGFGDYGAGREVYFYADSGSEDVSYSAAYQSSADDPRIQNGLNFRIQHLASTRELVYSYQPDGVSDWTELARINLSTGAATGLSGDGTLTGQLPDSSQNLFFAVDVDKYSTEPTPIENIEIGGIEIGSPPVLVESDGEASLLKGGGYYYIDSLSLPITYNGSPVTDYQGYRYIGVEPDDSGGYELILLAEGTGVYNVWSVSSAGEAGSFTALSAGELALLESQWNQDINGDDDVGLTLNSIEIEGSSSLLQDNVGGYYYIDSLSLPITYNGSPVTDYQGYRYIGVEPDDSGGYELILLAEGTGVYNVWSVSSAGEAGSFTALSAGELALLESQWNQDINGDDDVGLTLNSIEIEGSSSLLQDNVGGYYYIDSLSLPITYNGSPVTDYQGYRYIGVEPDDSGGYELILLAEGTGVYNVWSVSSAGEAGSFTALSAGELALLESQWNQDINGDDDVGLTLNSIEIEGSSSLLQDNVGGYYYIDSLSLPITYNGSPVTDYQGYRYIGVEPDDSGGYELILLAEGTGVYNVWSVSSAGEAGSFTALSAGELALLESQWNQDINGDDDVGLTLNSIEIEGSSSLLQDNVGGYYYIDSLSLPITYNGSPVTDYQGYRYIGVEPDDSGGYELILLAEGTGVYNVWSVSSAGEAGSFTALSAGELALLESQWNQDINGDDDVGLTLNSIEIEGSSSLLQDNVGGYYYIDSLSLPITYNGSPVTDYQGYRYIGVEPDDSGGYELILLAEGTGVYNVWSVSSAGEAGSFTALSAGELALLESQWNQDINGDDDVGLTLNSIEIEGSSSLLQDNVGGYYYIDSLSLPITYNGSPVTDYQGYRYIGVEPDDSGGYELILLAEGTGVYNVWSVSSAGEAGSFTALSAGEVIAKEESWNQDINGDSFVGPNPNSYAIYTLEPGTIINGVDHTSFIGSSNDMVSFYKDPYDGVDIAPVSYVRTGANTATFVEGAGTEYYYGGISTYPAQSTTVTFTSPNSVTRDYDGNVYTLTFPEDLAPTSLAGLNVATNSTGYSNIYGGYSGSAALNFSTSSNGTYYGTNTLPINYTYQKIGPREGRLNATGNVPNYGTVNASYIFHFLTAATGYFVGQETYTSSDLVETSWGTFEIY